MKATIRTINGGVTSAQGFQAGGAHVGLKRKRKDLAILVSDCPAVMAGTFTQNTAKAPPVLWNHNINQKGEPVKALVINSGNANSCTGPMGPVHAKMMAEALAKELGAATEEVLVSSTGIIGVPLPIDDVVKGIGIVSQELGHDRESGKKAAEAIMTTDAYTKELAVQFEVQGKTITLGAMAKGSGMVHPNMATMLSFITTDLKISKQLLQKALSESVNKTYNMISVDGDSSTNDMVVAMANGMAGNEELVDEDMDYHLFADALNYLNEHLAKSIAADGEGASKLLEVEVEGANSLAEARTMARAIISSNLVKTAAFANDPNWGRIVAALGSTGVPFDMTVLDISMGGNQQSVYLVQNGTPMFVESVSVNQILKADQVCVTIALNQGQCSAKAWGCDLTHEYIERTCRYTSDHVIESLPKLQAMVQEGEVA